MAFKFNGTVATIADTTGLRVVTVTDNDGNNKIDITGSEEATHQYEAGLDDPEITFEVLGADAIVRGQTGDTNVIWTDTTPAKGTDLGTSVVVGKSKTGSIDSAIVYSITVVPAES